VVEWGEDALGYNTSPGGEDQYHSHKTGKRLLELLDEVAEFRDWYVNRPKIKKKPTAKKKLEPRPQPQPLAR
jgi:hypothetical protein